MLIFYEIAIKSAFDGNKETFRKDSRNISFCKETLIIRLYKNMLKQFSFEKLSSRETQMMYRRSSLLTKTRGFCIECNGARNVRLVCFKFEEASISC